MRCEHCKVDIESAGSCCPLCHEVIAESNLFPVAKKTKRHKIVSFSLIYLISTLVASIIAFSINIYYQPELKWSLSVLGLLAYGYVLIAGTIISKRHVATKILVQIFAIAALTAFLEFLTPSVKWSSRYAVPVILFGGGLLLGFLSLIVKRSGIYAICLLFIALAGLGPLLYSLIIDEVVLWPSIACAVGCGAMLIAVTIYGLVAKKSGFNDEIKRKFHT